MKKILLSCLMVATLSPALQAQGPGLVISEVMANPAGTDSPFEYVELVATRTINFSVTPYSVVFTNNGTATTQGWVAGGGITYGFDITTGTVNQGDVVYVGGSTMAPTGTKLRVINTGTTNGDGFGNLNTGGVLGNGGGNCDGIGVFATGTSSLTSSTVPIDALFFGTGAGTAVVSGGTAGYQLPYSDLYIGGKLQTTSFLAADPTSGTVLEATAGVFNTTTGSFTTTRTFTSTAGTDLTTGIAFTTATANVSFAMPTSPTNQTISETTSSTTFTVTVSSANSAQAIVQVVPSGLSTAVLGVDYTITNPVIVAPAGSTTSQMVTLTILNDALLEQKSEYSILTLSPLTNASVTGTNLHALYITDDENVAPVESNELVFSLLGSFSNGLEGSNSAEIVAHDPSTQRLYIANSVGAKLDIVDFSNPSSPSIITSIPVMPTYGNLNSVAVYNGLVACAIENSTNPQDSGKVVFFDANGTFINSVKVGAMPDMLTFNHAGNKILVACEGEPNAAYTSDPQGRVCSIDLTPGAASLTQSNVTFINFTAYDGMEATLRASGIRIYGPGATASMDFEPEYVTISDDDQTAWVSLQENNALAVIDLTTNTITQLLPLGYKDLSTVGYGLDCSDQTAGINIANFPIKAMTLPDALAHFSSGGNTYVVTANEGDTRAYSGFNEESRISGGAVSLDPTAFPYATQLKNSAVAGRLNVTTKLGDTDGDGDLDELYALGGRSFSIYNATTGALVFDSGDDFERILSTHPTYSALFNVSNTSAAPVAKNRSDDKGPECEGVTVAQIDGEFFAFASLERIGGVMIYNITDPANPVYVGYHNNRTFALNGPDRGAEGMIYIEPANSPNGNAIMLLANEISSTLTIYEINTCKSVSGVSLMTTLGDTICDGDTTVVYTSEQPGVSYQWFLNGSMLTGETDTLFEATNTGFYTVGFFNASSACSDSVGTGILVNPLPTVMANASSSTVCSNDSLTLFGSGAASYTWDNSAIDMMPFLLASTTTFNVIGLDTNGCSNTSAITITVNTSPTVIGSATDNILCTGESSTLTGSGAISYSWTGGVTDGVSFTPSTTADYVVTGTASNGCTNTDTVNISVINLNVGAIATFTEVCQGGSTALNGTGAATYVWSDGVNNGIGFVPAATQYYNVTGTDVNGCTDIDSILIEVLPLPSPVITYSAGVLSIPTYSSMQWYLNGVIIPGATSSTYTPSADGVYTVVVTDPSSCTGTSAGLNLNWSSILNSAMENSIMVYPNPVNNQLTIELGSIAYADVMLTNLLGEELMKANGSGKITLNVNDLAKGAYLVHVHSNGVHQTMPIIKN